MIEHANPDKPIHTNAQTHTHAHSMTDQFLRQALVSRSNASLPPSERHGRSTGLVVLDLIKHKDESHPGLPHGFTCHPIRHVLYDITNVDILPRSRIILFGCFFQDAQNANE